MPFPVSGLIDLTPWSDPGACFWVSFGDLPEHIHMYTQVYTLVHIYSHLCTHMYTCIHMCTYAHTQSFLLVLSSRGWSPGSHCLLNRSPNTPLLTTLTLGFPSMGQTVCSLLTPEDLSHFFFPKPTCVCLHAQPCLIFVSPQTVAHQAPLSMGFPRQQYWSGLPSPPPGDLPNPVIEPTPTVSLSLAGGAFATEP